MKTYVGVDYHKKFSYGTIMTEEGEIIKQGRFANHPEAVSGFLGEHSGASCSAVLEATRNWTVMHDWLEELVDDVTLAHPLKVKAIAEAKIKTDKIDATTLAHLLRCDLIPSDTSSSRAFTPGPDTDEPASASDVPGSPSDYDQEPHPRAAGPSPIDSL